MPLVSVVIPTFGKASFLEATLLSVLNQTHESIEIVVIDDGSPGGPSPPRITHSRSRIIKYHYISNRGQAAARNYGAQVSSGDLLIFLDHDDIWLRDTLEFLVAAKDGSPCKAIGGLCQPFGRTFSRRPVENPSLCSRLTVEEFYWGSKFHTPGQVLLDRELFESLGGFNLNPNILGAEDLDLWIRIAAHSDFCRCHKVVLKYRFHGNNNSNNLPRQLSSACRVLSSHLLLFSSTNQLRIKGIAERSLRRYMIRRYTTAIIFAVLFLDLAATARLLRGFIYFKCNPPKVEIGEL